MLLSVLQRIEDFQSLDADALTTVARHARVLRIPPNRTLSRPGQTLKGRYYLLHGRLSGQAAAYSSACAEGRRVLSGNGCVRTLTEVQLLHVDWDPIAFVARPAGAAAAEAPLAWEAALLDSPLMQQVGSRAWPRILTSLQAREARAGTVVLREGQGASPACYILAAGRAEVRRGPRLLKQLQPGDLFGEDAVITGDVRNASVVMSTPGRVMRLPARVLMSSVVARAIRAREPESSRLPLNVGRHRERGMLHVPLLELRERLSELSGEGPFSVSGGRIEERLLGALLLVAAGLDACMVPSAGERAEPQAGTVRPSAQTRSDEMRSACSTDMG